MNGSVETLNRWGEIFCVFAWPMLWQSSLLIAIVFAFDFLLARRVRASVRYALWAALLVKLILPPSLALPTGATWWFWRPHAAVEQPQISNYSVSFGNSLPDDFAQAAVPVVLPPARISGDAWALLAVAAMAGGLLSWLAIRWLRVAGMVRRAATAPSELDSLLEESRKLAGLRRRPRLKLVEEAQSPAVYGLWSPVILLPRTLAKQLSDAQLRTVLLHEAVHLRRGDVWMNCGQTLLQIAYWWHPLLWMANARIRRLREEAVDDAVMLALRDGADAYAPTLLEVAKHAFRRPLASLGLVGILESQSALRQRVERLVNFRPPRKSGVTLLSLCGIFAFCAVALPMGQGPGQPAGSFSSDTDSNDDALTLHVNPDVFIRNIKARASWTMEGDTNDYSAILFDILESAALNCAPPHGFSFNPETGTISTRNSPEQLEIFRRVIEELNRPDGKWSLQLTNRPVRKNVFIQGDFFWMTSDHFEKLIAGATYHPGGNGTGPCWTADPAQLQTIRDRAKSMGLHAVSKPRIQTTEGCTAEMSFGNATNSYRLECDPYVYAGKIVLPCRAQCMFTTTGRAATTYIQWEAHSKQTLENNGGIILRESSPGGSSNFVVILHAHVVSSGARAAATGAPGLEMRTFKVGTNVFLTNFRDLAGAHASTSDTNVSAFLKRFFEAADVDLSPPKTVFFSNRLGGVLFVYATSSDLDAIERIVDTLHEVGGSEYLQLASIINSPKDTNAVQYESRTFRVDPNSLFASLQQNLDPAYTPAMGTGQIHGNKYDPPYISTLAEEYFTKLGLKMNPPKSVFYDDRLSALFVYATPSDLQVIEKVMPTLSGESALFHVKARFLEVPQKSLSSSAMRSLFPDLTNGCILPHQKFQALLRRLESEAGTRELAEPEVTTISGRQVEMRATVTQTIITNFTLEAPAGAGAGTSGPGGKFSRGSTFIPQTTQVETGPAMDLVPILLSDGYTIRLRADPSEIDFAGYATAQGIVSNVSASAAATGFRPVFKISEAPVDRFLYDGQTVILFLRPEAGTSRVWDGKAEKPAAKTFDRAEEKNGDTVEIVLVTASLIDGRGNRIHSENELQFADTDVPAQSP